MIRPVTSADRAVLRELLAEFYDTDAVLHPLPASYHDAALDELFRSDSLQRACLLEQDGETAGYGLLSLKYSHEAGGWSCGWRSCMSAPPSAAAAWAMNSSHGCAAFPQRSIFAASGWKRSRKTSARRPSMPVWAFRRWAIARCSGRKQHDLS